MLVSCFFCLLTDPSVSPSGLAWRGMYGVSPSLRTVKNKIPLNGINVYMSSPMGKGTTVTFGGSWRRRNF